MVAPGIPACLFDLENIRWLFDHAEERGIPQGIAAETAGDDLF
jgi:hypothetical protein